MSFVDEIVVRVEDSKDIPGLRHSVFVTDQEGDTVQFTKARWGTDHGTFLVKIEDKMVEVPFRAIKQFLAAFDQI